MASCSYSAYRTPPIVRDTRQGYNPRPRTPLSAPRWETLPEHRSPSHSVPPSASMRHWKRSVNEVDGAEEVYELESPTKRYAVAGPSIYRGNGYRRGGRPNHHPSPRTQRSPGDSYDAFPKYRSPSLSLPSPIWKLHSKRPIDGVERGEFDEWETPVSSPSNRQPYGRGRGGRRNYPSTRTHWQTQERLPTPHSEHRETRMSSFPAGSRRGGARPGGNHFNNGYSSPLYLKQQGKQKAVIREDDEAPMMSESEPLTEETETQASTPKSDPKTSRVSSRKDDTQMNPSGSENTDERPNASQDNVFDGEDQTWVHNLAVELGLSEESEKNLRNIALDSDDRKTLFLVDLILNRRPVDIPSKAKEKFNAIALKLLLNFSGSGLFKDRFLNVFRFSVYIAPRLDRMGLDMSWTRDAGKMKTLDVQWQKNFGAARRQIIEAINASINKEIPLSELAKSLRKKRPNNDELNMFALMRQMLQDGGRKGFFDRVDDKLREMHAMSMKEYKKEFKRYRKKDKRQFPEPETPEEE